MTTPYDHKTGKRTPSRMSRRQLLRLAGGAVLAAGVPGRRLHAGFAPLTGQDRPSGALARYDPPAKIRDFPVGSARQRMLDNAWNINANGWVEQAILGDPWAALYASHQNYYYNPLHTDLSGGTQLMITWPAFPNRILYYYPNLSQTQQYEFADTGTYKVNGVTVDPTPNIAQDAQCAVQAGQPIGPWTSRIPYGPYGPRGWLDEYCEMAVERDGENGPIKRIHFTCENPEYWYTLWSIDPERVAEIYRETLENDSIRLEDLQLRVLGEPVIDPATGRPAYNPLNKWNSGTVMTAAAGGAMHLTSTPNTLQTELQLAGGATVQRSQGNENGSQLICCGAYGQSFRNSDPHIGQVANQAVGLGFRIALANPIGLYIQLPNFSTWRFSDNAKSRVPAGARPSDVYHVVRGHENLDGFASNFNFIVHAKVEVPPEWEGVTLEDIEINGNALKYGSQLLQTFDVALFPLGVPAKRPAPQVPCVVSLPDSNTGQPSRAFPQQIMPQTLWDAYYSTTYPVPYRRQGGTAVEPDGEEVTMSLASNTIIVAPRVRPGKTTLALLGGSFSESSSGELPHVEFVLPGAEEADAEIGVEVLGMEDVVYAVPGNSTPGAQQMLRLLVRVGADAVPGQRDLRVTNPGQSPGPAARFFLWVLRDEA